MTHPELSLRAAKKKKKKKKKNICCWYSLEACNCRDDLTTCFNTFTIYVHLSPEAVYVESEWLALEPI